MCYFWLISLPFSLLEGNISISNVINYNGFFCIYIHKFLSATLSFLHNTNDDDEHLFLFWYIITIWQYDLVMTEFMQTEPEVKFFHLLCCSSNVSVFFNTRLWWRINFDFLWSIANEKRNWLMNQKINYSMEQKRRRKWRKWKKLPKL